MLNNIYVEFKIVFQKCVLAKSYLCPKKNYVETYLFHIVAAIFWDFILFGGSIEINKSNATYIGH